jgi:hypothetical protein
VGGDLLERGGGVTARRRPEGSAARTCGDLSLALGSGSAGETRVETVRWERRGGSASARERSAPSGRALAETRGKVERMIQDGGAMVEAREGVTRGTCESGFVVVALWVGVLW